MRKMPSRRRCCGRFDTSIRTPAEMGVRGCSESFATPVSAGAAKAREPHPTRSMKKSTATARSVRDPETLALQAEDVCLIERAMRSLPVRSRELLVLRELEGLSYQELAAALGIPMGTVMSTLSRARQAFRGAMESQLKTALRLAGKG